MLQNHYKYVLVGGGLTSGSAAEAIRLRDPAGSILLVGQEVNRPYHRPRLNTHYLRGERGRTEILVQSPDWFASQHIDLSTGRRAALLDTHRETVILDSGEEIAFDRLLIATGSSPAVLGIPNADLPNVISLRTVHDADRLHNAVEKAKVEGHRHSQGPGRGIVAIVGGGLLGVELSETLTSLGLSVELIVDAAHPWKKFAGETTGKLATHVLESHGVRVRTGQRPLRLEGDGRVQRVVLADGSTIVCDFVVSAIGIRPNKEILRGTTITAEKAILVNDRCQTSDPNIYAAGDCAAIFDPLFGKHRIIDHWENARVSGAIAGDNMAGGSARYEAVNTFRTDVFNLHVTCWGEPRLVDRRHIRGNVSIESPDYVEIGVAADGRIAQVLAVGHNDEDALLATLVKQRVQIDGKEEALKDPIRSLSEFVQL